MVDKLNIFLKVILLTITVILISKITIGQIDQYKQYRNTDIPISMVERERQLTCLAKNIYFEAASEPFEGKVAVAQVTINRAESGRYPSDICDVVYQKNVVYGRVICQFSWYCESGPRIRHNDAYKESMEVAKRVLLENFRLPSLKNAYFYHADYVSPNWKLPKITQIGRHIFYGQKV
jgi:spore germination cell wall hydrolase CwlJ-like protein